LVKKDCHAVRKLRVGLHAHARYPERDGQLV
jgi:hypothetical protein